MAELDVPVNDRPTVLPSKTENGLGLAKGAKVDVKEVNGDKVVTIAVIGAGQRGQVYANYALKHPDKAKIVAVAEPRLHRRKVMSRAHAIPPEMQFADYSDLLDKGRIADAVLICVLDDLHAELVERCVQLGYHILCEKPMATSIGDCVKMLKDVNGAAEPRVFGIGHVLRYSPFNQAVKEVIDSGALGEIVNIQHIEPVGNQHFAHSYVRGNWSKEKQASFGLMTKSCHDIDILSYYLSGLTPSKVSSFGSLHLFRPEKKPAKAGNATRCLDCAYESECVWSAKKIYVDPLSDEHDRERWARHVVDADVLDIENVTDALKTSQYGQCVYEADNDIVDHQVVNIEYEGGVTASMTMSAFSEAICERATVIQGTKGELKGDMATFTVFDFLTRTSKHYAPPPEEGSHGGGDTGLSRTFVRAVAANDQSILRVTPQEVLNSHLLVFAAETARRQGRVVEFKEFREDCMEGRAAEII